MKTTLLRDNPWFLFNSFRENTKIRIFCFPYAGGGASIYHQWSSNVPCEIEICPIQLPGRESRIHDRPFDNIRFLVQELAEEIVPYLDRPYAFFGHSMGALIIFELARELRRLKVRKASRLFISGRNAPHVVNLKPPIHQLNDRYFINQLRELSGTPESILQNEELMELVIPYIRNDFKMVETYEYREEPALDIPFSVIGGTNDPGTPIEFLKEWNRHTLSSFTLNQVEGNHFFLKNRFDDILDIIYYDLFSIELYRQKN